MTKRDPQIQCGHCDGRGVITLPTHLRQTLAVVRLHGPVRVTFVADMLGINHTAAINRLTKLRGLGLAKRGERDELGYTWSTP